MNFFGIRIDSHHILGFYTKPACTLLAFAFALTGVSAAESLTVERQNSPSGIIASANLKTEENRLFVSGLVRLLPPSAPSSSVHVDVYLLGKEGKILGKQKSRVVVTSRRSDRTQNRHFPYAVSFDEKSVAHATAIRVTYCNETHPVRES